MSLEQLAAAHAEKQRRRLKIRRVILVAAYAVVCGYSVWFTWWYTNR
jgi:hypothetical protein